MYESDKVDSNEWKKSRSQKSMLLDYSLGAILYAVSV